MAKRIDTLPKKRPVQRRAQTTVDAILAAAAHILIRDGYDALSTNRVAERAGVSIGSLYQYFPNKEALVGDLVDRYSDMMFGIVAQAFGSMTDADPRAFASVMVRAMIDTNRKQGPRLVKVLREQIPRTGRLSNYELKLDRIIELTAVYLDHHRMQLRVADPRVGAFVSVHMVDALTHATVTQRPKEEDETMIAEITDAVVRYLLRDRDSDLSAL
jgi:AcrR family transcriptional regulator